MFVYQQSFAAPCVPVTPELFEQVTHDPKVKQTIAEARPLRAQGDTKGYDARKRSLPMFIFMCTFTPNKGAKGEWGENTWRLQRAAVLNGLVMLDYDHLDEQPAKERAVDVFNRIPSHMFDDDCDNQILYAARTCSGDYGLRLVCKADPKRGNLADNQAYISRILNLHCDESIKNADRTSFVNYFDDIFYINKKEIFTYSNEEYDKMFGGNYRRGDSRPKQSDLQPTPDPSRAGGEVDCLQGRIQPTDDTQHPSRTGGDGGGFPVINSPSRLEGVAAGRGSREQAGVNAPQPPLILEGESVTPNAERTGLQGNQSPLPSGGDGGGLFRGVPYTKICEEWLKARGGAPAAGSRHMRALQLASDLRYICDNKPANVQAVLMQVPFVKEIVSERGDQEIENICNDVCDRRMNLSIPRTLQAVLQAVLQAAGVNAPQPPLILEGESVTSSAGRWGLQGNQSPLPSGGDGGRSPMDYVEVTDSDLEFATLMYDAVIYWQDYFFGLSLQTAWDNAANGMKQRVKNSGNATGYLALPQEFDIATVVEVLKISNLAARSQVDRWLKATYVERIKRGMYRKIIQTL